MTSESDNNEEYNDEQIDQQQAINEEYKIWKKNAPYLYDLLITHSLEWPSQTIQWFPDVEEPPGEQYNISRLLLGTYTSGTEPEYIGIAKAQIPREDLTLDPSKFDEERGGFGGYGALGVARISMTQRIPNGGEINR